MALLSLIRALTPSAWLNTVFPMLFNRISACAFSVVNPSFLKASPSVTLFAHLRLVVFSLDEVGSVQINPIEEALCKLS